MAHGKVVQGMGTVLLVEPDGGHLLGSKRAIERLGHSVLGLASVAELLDEMRRTPPAAIVLSASLSGRSGHEVCRLVRTLSEVPILVCDVHGSADEEILCLSNGADDYLSRPSQPEVLAARLGALLRRSGGHDAKTTAYDFGDLHIDVDMREVLISGRPVGLTRTEFDLLVVLAESPRRVVPRAELIERVWRDWPDCDHVLDVHLSRLRAKLRRAGGPRVAVPLAGVGYRLGEPTAYPDGGAQRVWAASMPSV